MIQKQFAEYFFYVIYKNQKALKLNNINKPIILLNITPEKLIFIETLTIPIVD